MKTTTGDEIRIRPFRSDDSDVLWSMLEPVFRAGETYCIARDIDRETGLAYWLETPHKVYIAEAGGSAQGSYFLTANQGGGGAHVANCGFVTAPEARGRGLARAMLAHALNAARAAGFRAMQFNFVVATNLRAIAIWESHGFQVVGRLPRAFNHPGAGYVDALVMYRHL